MHDATFEFGCPIGSSPYESLLKGREGERVGSAARHLANPGPTLYKRFHAARLDHIADLGNTSSSSIAGGGRMTEPPAISASPREEQSVACHGS